MSNPKGLLLHVYQTKIVICLKGFWFIFENTIILLLKLFIPVTKFLNKDKFQLISFFCVRRLTLTH